MTTFTRRWAVSCLVAAAAVALAPGVAHAEPPTNDNVDTATVIETLPFSATQSVVEATTASDDPWPCGPYPTGSVWFRYTAPADAVVEVSVAGSTGYTPIVSAFTGPRGAMDGIPGFCPFAYGGGPTDVLHVTAGTTYHFMATAYYGGGTLRMDVTSVPASPNDDFAEARAVPGLPWTDTGDLRRASPEPGEALPSCDDDAELSVWYTYTPSTTRSVAVSALYPAMVAVHSGDAVDALTELDCSSPYGSGYAVFGATAGETYRIRVATNVHDGDRFQVRFETARPLTPWIGINPEQPSVFDEVRFDPDSGDQLGRPFVTGEVRFGDGTSAPIDGTPIAHRYAADGSYQVQATGTTADGRTGTVTETLVVQTHDVTVSSFTVPATARAGQTRPITASITNTRYDETVRVALFRQYGDHFVQVGVLTQWVPARDGHTVEFPFAHTFDTTGTVTFRVVASLPGYWEGDARPVDNTRTATTTVRSPAAGVL
jgi:hypothetical protein